jgi:hypothetical protein
MPTFSKYSPRLTKGEVALLHLKERLSPRGLRVLMQEEIAPAANRMMLRWWSTLGNGTWAPLKPSTVRSKIRKGTFSKGTLHDTDHLFKVLFRERATDSRLKSTPGGVRLSLGTNVRYAKFHQFGTSRMAQRQVVPNPLPRSFTAECKALIRAYLLRP